MAKPRVVASQSSTKLHGEFGIKVVNYDVNKLIALLNKAYADEWLAYHQYWLCAKLVEGPLRTEIAAELTIHAQEEYTHVVLIADRIIQLGGKPLLTPSLWYKHAGCTYKGTENSYVKVMVEENLKGEQCAIQFYDAALKTIDAKDPITYEMILKILTDEIEHEQDLTKFLNDLTYYS